VIFYADGTSNDELNSEINPIEFSTSGVITGLDYALKRVQWRAVSGAKSYMVKVFPGGESEIFETGTPLELSPFQEYHIEVIANFDDTTRVSDAAVLKIAASQSKQAVPTLSNSNVEKCLIPIPNNSGTSVFYCGFEQNNMCGGKIAQGSTFRWKFINQVTRDEGRNLASIPALTGTSYLVAPYDRKKSRAKDGQTIFTIPSIDSGVYCFRVAILINGKHTRGISIEIEPVSGGTKTLYNQNGMLSNRWKSMEFEIIQTESFVLVFRVPQGQAWHSAIGMDDISVVTGQC